jgi:hypothetical protein
MADRMRLHVDRSGAEVQRIAGRKTPETLLRDGGANEAWRDSSAAIVRMDRGHVSGESHARRNSHAAHVLNISRISRASSAHLSRTGNAYGFQRDYYSYGMAAIDFGQIGLATVAIGARNMVRAKVGNKARLLGRCYAEPYRMDDHSNPNEPRAGVSDPAVEVGVKFLQTLFAESDIVLFRPIETWVESGRKRSRVDQRNTHYHRARPATLPGIVTSLLRLGEQTPVNIFFGVCPRYGDKGQFDLSWQIRTVRALWIDIDHVTVDDARKRISEAGLPPPSMVVNSGNGVHLYWLLNEPYLIDDAGDPPPVETELIDLQGGRKKQRKFIVDNGERVFIEHRHYIQRLSPKAEHFQQILAGVAMTCGGDHAIDLARLLRLPGTFNRKDQRHGATPKATVLVECEPARKYPLAQFEPFKMASLKSERAKLIAAIRLPKPRKMSTAKEDKLMELISACGVAPVGGRSEVDFSLCCYAIRNGIDKEEVWRQVEQIGKFAEQGRRYYNLTWENAEYDVRVGRLDELQKAGSPGSYTSAAQPIQSCEAACDGNGVDGDGIVASGRPVIHVDPVTTPVAETLKRVTDCLLSTGTCFTRADQLVVVRDQAITSVLSSNELAGLLNTHVEFFFVDKKAGEYKPLPSAYANTWLNQHVGLGRLPVIKLFTHNPVYTADWRLVAPGFDPGSGIYYAGPAVQVHHSTKHLDALLKDFCFKTRGDRTNYIGMLLTAVLVPQFIGSKPAVLFNGNQPELGKTILAQIIATLRDGHPAETVTYNPNDEEFEKRLGAIVRSGVTTLIIDNAKGRGRNPRIESACLERSITDSILSFRLLGSSHEIRAENSHIFCITANAPDVSRDLVTRSTVINLYYEGDPRRRSFSIADTEGYAEQHRVELLGELIGMVERWKESGKRMAKVKSRFNKRGWGTIVGGILEACGEPDFLDNAAEAASLLDDTSREFTELVGILVKQPEGAWTAAELVDLCSREGLLTTELGGGSQRSMATKMGTIAGRFVAERFPIKDGSFAEFNRSESRKGNVYRVCVQ